MLGRGKAASVAGKGSSRIHLEQLYRIFTESSQFPDDRGAEEVQFHRTLDVNNVEAPLTTHPRSLVGCEWKGTTFLCGHVPPSYVTFGPPDRSLS